MADVEIPDTGASSYSDPFYDRLERAKNWMARRWPLLLILALLIMGVVLVIGTQQRSTPLAASAQAFLTAKEAGPEALQALKAQAADTENDAAFRVRARVAAAELLANDGDLAAAQQLLAEALPEARPVAERDGQIRLPLTVELSQAGLYEQAGDYAAAIPLYERVALQGASAAKALAFGADLGLARSYLAQAEAATDAGQALQLRQQAQQILAGRAKVAGSTGADAQVVQIATYMHEKLRLTHPEVFGGEPVAAVERAVESDESDVAAAPATSEEASTEEGAAEAAGAETEAVGAKAPAPAVEEE